VLFLRINPGLWSAATGFHFAAPATGFWPALHLSGFTPRCSPLRAELLLGWVCITNVVARATARRRTHPGRGVRRRGQAPVEFVSNGGPGFLPW